jgi:excisionase family DNA binding protein
MTADSTSTIGASHQPDELLLTVEEAARRLQLGRTLLYRLISSGDLESVTVGRLRRLLPAGVRGDGAPTAPARRNRDTCHTDDRS